jgi:hypothetical protein
VVTVDQQVVKLQDALGRYVSALEALASIRPCLSTWPADPAGPGYVGTRCQLLEGHVQRDGTKHRHRMLGSQVTVDWA